MARLTVRLPQKQRERGLNKEVLRTALVFADSECKML
jgi:hypothetical protein